MSVEVLRVNGVRNLHELEVEPGPGLNIFWGENGAGKTSILESLHCVATGRSFRSGAPTAWISRKTGRAEIFVKCGGHRLGVAHEKGTWLGRVDGATARSRAELSAHLPLFVFHPESHAIVGGPPEERRRQVDLGVFHVEPSFLGDWRAYRRAQKQRNAALKLGEEEQLAGWESEMARTGGSVTKARQRYVGRLEAAMQAVRDEIGARVPELELAWYPGWPEDEALDSTLRRSRALDLDRGYTALGAHRGDLRIRDADGVAAPRLSRGQEKIVALCLVAAQCVVFEEALERTPVLAVDDMGSELDEDHERRVAGWLLRRAWQVWVTGLERPRWLAAEDSARWFHVEHGTVRSVV